MANPDADVIVVGAGPTGLTTANCLGVQGVRTILIERNSGIGKEPRAVSIDDEAMRILQTIGLVENLIPHTIPGYGARYYSPNKREFARIKPTTLEFGHPRRSAFHQPELEAILYQGLKRFPHVKTLFNNTFIGFEQDENGITITIKNNEGVETKLKGTFLAACDGGKSFIRRAIGAKMRGSSFEERWLVIDTINDFDDESDSIAYCDHRRPAITLPGPNKTRRWEFLVHKNEDGRRLLEEENISELLKPYISNNKVEIIRKIIYTFHARVADKWQESRIFLLGDSAHLTPPYAGQGMNSGQRDAANFSWKVATVVRSQFTPQIMKTYESERREHAWSLIQMAIQIGWAMVPRNWLHTYSQVIFFHIINLIPKLREYFLGMKFKPIPRFHEGFLCPDGRSAKTTLIGRMLPQPTVRTLDGKKKKLDDVIGYRFALLKIGDTNASDTKQLKRKIWTILETVNLTILFEHETAKATNKECIFLESTELLPSFRKYYGWTLLVRPDRYVAAAFKPEEERRVEKELWIWLSENK
ncbi:MAG: 3-(3-hydroxyphenyl)propionate hydroxylase [Rhodospirillaceae bacterium]|nr:3-(3-hydroxyphenyl)propionate hydroxylase [Rhodospirillaceae bacterium]